jgi:hypothetical protein
MRSRYVMYKSAIPVLLLLFSLACGKSSNQDTTATHPAASSDSSAASSPAASGQASTKATTEKGSAAESSAGVTVPAGTVITVRLGETLSSKTSEAGQAFSATVAQPVQVNGAVVIPSGSTAHGTVVVAHPLGRFKGGALLEVRLNSVNVNGNDMNVRTAAVARSMKGKGKRSLVMAGGGAGLGALIGGLAGGGKGAAIGALAGGGAGTAGAAFTGNKDIVLPAESALTFKLTQPLEVKK